MFVINKQVITGSKVDLFPGRAANLTATPVTPLMGGSEGLATLLLPACATLMLAALALLLAMSERWPRAVATAIMAIFLILAAIIFTYGLEDEPPVTFA